METARDWLSFFMDHYEWYTQPDMYEGGNSLYRIVVGDTTMHVCRSFEHAWELLNFYHSTYLHKYRPRISPVYSLVYYTNGTSQKLIKFNSRQEAVDFLLQLAIELGVKYNSDLRAIFFNDEIYAIEKEMD